MYMEGDLFVPITAIAAVVIIWIFTLWQVKIQHRERIRQMKEKTVVLKHKTCNDKRLEALQRCWGMLIYTADRKNAQSIITYTIEKDDERERKVKTYFFHKSNIDAFINSLCSFFYAEGWGVYLSEELKELLFAYEHIVWRLKLAARRSPEEVQTLRNHKVAEDLFDLHQQLTVAIRQDMEMMYKA
jgi:hypothetical protein